MTIVQEYATIFGGGGMPYRKRKNYLISNVFY